MVKVLQRDSLTSHTDSLAEPGIESRCVHLQHRETGVPGCLTVFVLHPMLLPRGDPAASGQAAEDEMGTDVEADRREGTDGHALHVLS